MTKQEHIDEASKLLVLAYQNNKAHSRLAGVCLSRYGDHGSLIAGCVRDHFPEQAKDTLRTIARKVGSLLDSSRVSWKLARKQHRTWMRLKDETIRAIGRGYYG